MSYQAIDAVLRHSTSRGRARLLLLAIAHHAGPDGTGARPGMATLISETKIERRNLQRLLRMLEEGGELSVKIGGGPRANQYEILLPIAAGTGAPGGVLTAGTIAASGEGAPGLKAARRAAHEPPQQPLVVGNVGFSNQNNNIGRAQLLAELERETVAHGIAVDLVTKFPARVVEQLAYLDDRGARDRAATLVRSIQENWKAPAAYAKRQQEAEAERQKKREAEEARDRSAREAEEADRKRQNEEAETQRAEAEGAQLDARFEAMSEAERAAIDAKVTERLSGRPAFMQTEWARKFERRDILREGDTAPGG